MEDPHNLRKLAEWYRSMAEIGHSDDRVWRISFADYLERRAREAEKSGEDPTAANT